MEEDSKSDNNISMILKKTLFAFVFWEGKYENYVKVCWFITFTPLSQVILFRGDSPNSYDIKQKALPV